MMQVFNSSDAQTFWLNVTNVALGIGILLCFVALGYAFLRDAFDYRRRRLAMKIMDRELRGAMARVQSDLLYTPGLGWTMADGGEPFTPPAKSEDGSK